MTLAAVTHAAATHGLCVMGVDGPRVLLGTDAGWWPLFCASPEAQDGAPHPIDRWSKRVIDGMADAFGGEAVYPSDGPPYPPFIAWARATGRFWQSPTGMLVHDTAGLMISIRGALILSQPMAAPATGPSPCKACVTQPCTTACPVGALSGTAAYDVPACKAFLQSEAGADTCMTAGCRVRRACPVSQSFGRPPEQSAAHMRAFVG